jgi:hypothetical protein
LRLVAVITMVVLQGVAVGGCGGDSRDRPALSEYELTSEQLENGIGPISSLELGELDADLVQKGAALFETRCSACHNMGARMIGPDLARVLERRSPAYVMNMILNPDEMIERHPEARALLREFMTPMANQGLSKGEARAIVEWLRTVGG